MHELGHAIGLYHEHQRGDREDYVVYNPFCVQAGKSGNFDKRAGLVIGPYDQNSIMHYRANAFSIAPNCPTLIPKQGTIGGSVLTSGDIAGLDFLASF